MKQVYRGMSGIISPKSVGLGQLDIVKLELLSAEVGVSASEVVRGMIRVVSAQDVTRIISAMRAEEKPG